MGNQDVTVLKFGGSVLQSDEDLARVVHEIYRYWRRGSQVLAVVSAFGGTTDALIQRSKSFGDDPHARATASLLFTGEATSAALLTLALDRSGIPAELLSPAQLDLRTSGEPLDSEPRSVDVERVRKELERAVVVVSGFAGLDDEGNITLLGRGGTDYTALFLADQLDARCILIKDVDGLYDSDPADKSRVPHRYDIASHETTIRTGGELVQPKAVRFAEQCRLPFEIRAIGADYCTTVQATAIDRLSLQRPPNDRVRVALLGCGTVGGGVYERLVAQADLFEVSGVVNLDPAKALAKGISAEHLRRDVERLIEEDCDVVIELIGGIEPARSYVERALRLGRHVVTANKALIATCGEGLHRLAEQNEVTIRYSSSVGGAMPALESINKKRLRAVSGIINGTCNFIFDKLAAGLDMESAIRLAQEQGFAEADPTLDLNGTDAAQKLVLLARKLLGVELSLDSIERKGILDVSLEAIAEAASRGNVYRLVAECRISPHGVDATVQPSEFPASHVFAQTKGANNCLLVEAFGGERRIIRGRGAGRHATTESVMADLFDTRHVVINERNEICLEAAA